MTTQAARASVPATGSVASAQRPLRRDAERNRLRILQAASDVFAERGVEASLDDIAQQAGVGVGTVYRRFPSKDDLIEALFEQKIQQVVAIAEAAAAQPAAWDALVFFLERAVALQVEDLGLRQVLLSRSYGQDRVGRVRARLGPLIGHLVSRAQAEGSLRSDIHFADIPLILQMVGAIGTYTQGVEANLWRRYLTILLEGLRARPGGRRLAVPALTEDQLEEAMRAWDPARRLPTTRG